MARLRSTEWVTCSSPSLFRERRGSGCLSRHRDAHYKRAAGFILVVAAQYLSAMRPHDAVANTQSQPCAFGSLLRRVKGIENPLRVLNARTIVGDRNFDVRSLLRSANRNSPALASFLDRVVSIVQNIQ